MSGIGIGLSPTLSRKRTKQLSDITSLAWYIDSSSDSKLYQDNPPTVLSTVSTPVKLAQAALGSGSFSAASDAARPTRNAWDARTTGLFCDASTDLLSADSTVLASQNNVPGFTFACVLEMPPVLTTLRHILRITSSSGGNKYVLYQETTGKLYLITRRLASDTAPSSLGDPATALTGGQRYLVICSVNYSNGAGVIEVNGTTTGQGISGTYSWSGGYGTNCEAANPTIFTLSSATQPFTLGTICDPVAYTKALSSTERAYVRSILNAKYQVY